MLEWDAFTIGGRCQSYTLVEVLPADDDRVAVVETSISDEGTALA